MKQSDMQQLKNTLLEELRDLKEGLETHDDIESTELSNYDNHPGDIASDLTIQLTEYAMDDFKQESIDKIEAALNAMEEGTYGECKVCHQEIPFDRLEAIPTTLTCVEHSQEKVDMETRPVEEEIMNELSQKSLKTVDFEDGSGEFPSSDSPQDVPQEVIHQNNQETTIRDQFQ
ncbi:TraR/DksA C4-type zinc finger protein [Ureibacillus chungkukjangi]|uniref:TraR/DksA family transcriptional regulator n=1 Tax=Ureibacillus chungkukjangi TaxID=1202712 RepID=A0A318TJB5_9BACL|nr:TraR/DksA C4-type zinc finger protein [Ureibacillus chungkukjangi]PYF01955.1 TraR/DksA family transcriptional regulator [Ureibacillus chungkukjangi]